MEFPNSRHLSIPPLAAKSVINARLFSDRYEQIKHIREMMAGADNESPNVAEIGVALGDFSKFLIDTLAPKTFAAIDIFDAHEKPFIWDIPTDPVFRGRTHFDYYKEKFENYYKGRLIVEKGLSSEAGQRLEDNFYDLIYIDAGHKYEDVLIDTKIALAKIRPGGFIVFNDYTVYDHLSFTAYGVVPAVNQMLAKRGDVQVVGFSLDAQMFCDLAVQVA